jgi:hypothetical protein
MPPITLDNLTLWSGLTFQYESGIVTDPYWNNVTFLENFEAPASGIIDGSTNNFQGTILGSARMVSFSPFTTGSSIKIDSDSQSNQLQFPANAVYNASTNNFTAEAWVYFNTMTMPGTIGEVIAIACNTNSYATVRIVVLNTGGVYFLCQTSGTGAWINTSTAAAGTITAGSWYHIAAVRNGSTFTLYVNGVSKLTYSSASAIGFYSTAPTCIGNMPVGSSNNGQFDGYVTNARWVNGTAVYTSAFTPSTLPLPATQSANVYGNPSAAISSGTGLLVNATTTGMPNNSTFVDISKFAAKPTVGGTPYYAGLTPLTNTYPGSIYFNGSSYFTMPTNAAYQFGTGNFTVEFWMRPTSIASGDQILFNLRNPDTANLGFNIATVSSQLTVNTSGTRYIQGTTTLLNNTWYHVALSRTSTTSMRLYLNGVQEGSTYAVSQNFTNQIPVIAAFTGGAAPFFGYMSNVRIVKGVGVYTANFTPSTLPLPATQSANTYGNPSTAITGTQTSLLIPGTTGGFQDLSNSGQRITNTTSTTSVKTVSATQQFKFGTQSNTLLPTAYQTVIDDTSLQFGTGDFTIEGWVYTNAAGVLYGIINKGASTPTGWSLEKNASNQLVWYSTSTAVKTSTDTIPASTWTYFAISRSGTNLYMFINGTLQGSAGTDSTNYNQTNNMIIGATRALGNGLNGYLDDLRITKGVCRYTASFSAPTAAFPTS